MFSLLISGKKEWWEKQKHDTKVKERDFICSIKEDVTHGDPI